VGVILDSSVVIAAERAKLSPDILIEQVLAKVGDQQVALSAIGYTELLHALYRAERQVHRTLRRLFLDELLGELPVYPYTEKSAELAAKIGAEAIKAGNTIPYADLLIGATALSLGFSVLTSNERDFRKIDGLDVISFQSRSNP